MEIVERILEELQYEGVTRGSKYRVLGAEYPITKIKAFIKSKADQLEDLKVSELNAINKMLKDDELSLITILSNTQYIPPKDESEGVKKVEKYIDFTDEVFPAYVLNVVGRMAEDTPNGSLIFYNIDKRKILDARSFDYKTFCTVKYGCSLAQLNKEQVIPTVKIHFSPEDIRSKYDAKEEDVGIANITVLNSHVPPKYRLAFEDDTEQSISPFFKTLFTHLFPKPEELDYVLRWMRQAILGRNNTILVLWGDRGVGKTMFIEVLRSLLGHHYAANLDKSILEEKFTGILHEKRLGVFEEVSFADYGDDGQTIIEALKRLTNTMIKYESKGKDPFTARNHSSFVVALNKSSALGINPQERRFSIPKVTDIGLLEVLSTQEVSYYAGQLAEENPSEDVMQELKQLYNYLINLPLNGWSDSAPLKGDTYYEATERTLFAWQKFMLGILQETAYKEPAEIRLSEIRTRAAKAKARGQEVITIPYTNKIESFLSDYVHRGKCKVGYIDNRRDANRHGDIFVVLTPEYVSLVTGNPIKEAAPVKEKETPTNELDLI